MRVSRLVILSVLLTVVGGVGIALYAPKMQQSLAGRGVVSRMDLTSALRRAAVEVHDASGKWPATIAEMTSAPSLKGIDVQGAKYDLKDRKNGIVTYRLTYDRKVREVQIGEKSAKQDPVPHLAGSAASGG